MGLPEHTPQFSVREDECSSPQTGLHSWLWWCCYLRGAGAAMLYVWEWYHFQDYGEKNYRLLEEIREMVGTMRTVGTGLGKGGPEKMCAHVHVHDQC